jgi:hypothetical protein
MKREITDAEAHALLAAGWRMDSVHIGGRGYVTQVWNESHTYEASGIDRWYLIR